MDPVVTKKLPLAKSLQKYSGSDLDNLIQLRVMCFSKSTWFTYNSCIKPYIDYCKVRDLEPYPVDYINLELCCIQLIIQGKTSQTIEKL